jgi:hypothetical protein
MLKKIKLDKKAQLGETIQDVLAFVMLIILFVAMIVISLLLKQPAKVLADESVITNAKDRMHFFVLSLLQEKRDDVTFSDLLRSKDADAFKELEAGIKDICSQASQELPHATLASWRPLTCYASLETSCPSETLLDSNKFCYSIPSKNPIIVYVTVTRGVMI